MCDVKTINKVTKDIINMDLSDYRQLIVEADSEELRDYYMNMYNYFLQKRQVEVLKEHVY